jgi:hypothetical protein
VVYSRKQISANLGILQKTINAHNVIIIIGLIMGHASLYQINVRHGILKLEHAHHASTIAMLKMGYVNLLLTHVLLGMRVMANALLVGQEQHYNKMEVVNGVYDIDILLVLIFAQ